MISSVDASHLLDALYKVFADIAPNPAIYSVVVYFEWVYNLSILQNLQYNSEYIYSSSKLSPRIFTKRSATANAIFKVVLWYNGEYFQQHEGTAMGNSLSPFMANIFMSKFETEGKDKFEYFPRVWFRYVDDIFAMEQRVNLKFLVKLGKTFTEAYAMLKEVYGNECLSRTQVFEWFKRFKEGCEMTENDPRPGPTSRSKTDENIEKNW
ncbi:hypothetical protein NQ318_002603 [Aromia moschata]|uniref:Reverse transcriptase domain-containing protein n=1 Tax=Aromia moschata TaxID=1265417 RepID=A0AAV8XWE4_9CUCU|nr:hypothetical protein NQ318_002603 [Aromia moschata]